MWIRIYENKVFGIASEKINLRHSDNGIEINLELATDLETELIDILVGDSWDFVNNINLHDSPLRFIPILEWYKWTLPHYDYPTVFEKQRQGFRVLNSDAIATLTYHFKPPTEGTFKILLAYGSTVAGLSNNGTLNVGYARIGVNGYNLTGYFNAIPFNLVNTVANQLYSLSTPEFTISNDKEIIIVTWTKTSNSGSGYLYVLSAVLKRI